MNKELEYIEKMICWYDDNFSQLGKERNQEHIKQLTKIKSILTEYEAIDNAEQTKAMECLESMEKYNSCQCPDGYTLGEWCREEFDTIKQALLKAQEPKKYLKCEDLEFDDEWKYQEVKLNGTKYTIKYKCGFDFFDNYYEVVKIYNKDKRKQLFTLYNNEQFFNDLHLERVE